MKCILAWGIAAALALPAVAQDRLQWWTDARFGMFIHWGIYTVPAGEWKGKPIAGLGEWIMNRGKIPIAEYEQFAAQFNPVEFDADKWVAVAKNAGMKYLTITAKHHDGFAMFGSKVSKYNIVDATPFHRDPHEGTCRRLPARRHQALLLLLADAGLARARWRRQRLGLPRRPAATSRNISRRR